VIRRIAVGGMGEIFLVRQQIAGVTRLVVVKRLLAELADDPQRLTMFVDEARIAANLSHPGIVAVHEFGHDADGYFIVMEYVPGHHVGRVLARAVRDGGRIPVAVGAYIVYEVARALDHAHHACDSTGSPLHIVHRDVSPSNVLVSFSGDVKLMDFGIARAANRSYRTDDGTIRGKFAYMAPEQIESTEVDAMSDVFSAGVLLWELTLGRRLFDGASDFETIRATLEQPIPRPTTIDASYPPALEAIVMAAVERDRSRRLGSAAELAAQLKAVLREHPADRDDVAAVMAKLFPGDAIESAKLEAPAQPPTAAKATALLDQPDVAEPAPTPKQRQRWAIAAAVAVVTAGLVVVGMIAWTSHGASSPAAGDGSAAIDVSAAMSRDGGANDPSTTQAGIARGSAATEGSTTQDGISRGSAATNVRSLATAGGSASSMAGRGAANDVSTTQAGMSRGSAGSDVRPAPGETSRGSAANNASKTPAATSRGGVANDASTTRATSRTSKTGTKRVTTRTTDATSSERTPVDAGVPDVTATDGVVHFRLSDGAATVYVIPPSGVTCNGRAIQTRCHGPPGSYSFVFQVPGGISFPSTITIGPGLLHCAVSLARKDTTCGTD
jgi:serine/threonine protein kinase